MQIILSGYYGFDNAGDEALLAAIVSSITNLAPEAKFMVFSGHPEKTRNLHQVRAVHYMSPRAVIRELRKSDLLISGGGSIFQDVTSLRSLIYYISIVALALWFNKPVIFYAQGLGPINRRFSRWLMKKVANRVDFITLRDEDSLQLLRELGITRPPCRVTADPVFSLEPDVTSLAKMGKLTERLNPKNLPMIGVSVRHWQALDDSRQTLAAVLDRLHNDGYQIVFLPLAYPEDVKASQKIIDLMQTPAILIDKALSSREHLAIIRKLHLVLGMRLHALIFAANQGVPFVGISYDPKIDAFLSLFAQTPLPLSEEAMYAEIQPFLDDQSRRRAIAERAIVLHEKARENAELALSLIKSRP